MIRTGEEYRAGLRDGREVWIDGERVQDVTDHPAFKPVVDLKARMYDMGHEPASAEIMSYREPAPAKARGNERYPTTATDRKIPVAREIARGRWLSQ